MAVVVLEDVHKIYRLGSGMTVRALRAVSLSFEPGEFVAVLGRAKHHASVKRQR